MKGFQCYVGGVLLKNGVCSNSRRLFGGAEAQVEGAPPPKLGEPKSQSNQCIMSDFQVDRNANYGPYNVALFSSEQFLLG